MATTPKPMDLGDPTKKQTAASPEVPVAVEVSPAAKSRVRRKIAAAVKTVKAATSRAPKPAVKKAVEATNTIDDSSPTGESLKLAEGAFVPAEGAKPAYLGGTRRLVVEGKDGTYLAFGGPEGWLHLESDGKNDLWLNKANERCNPAVGTFEDLLRAAGFPSPVAEPSRRLVEDRPRVDTSGVVFDGRTYTFDPGRRQWVTIIGAREFFYHSGMKVPVRFSSDGDRWMQEGGQFATKPPTGRADNWPGADVLASDPEKPPMERPPVVEPARVEEAKRASAPVVTEPPVVAPPVVEVPPVVPLAPNPTEPSPVRIVETQSPGGRVRQKVVIHLPPTAPLPVATTPAPVAPVVQPAQVVPPANNTSPWLVGIAAAILLVLVLASAGGGFAVYHFGGQQQAAAVPAQAPPAPVAANPAPTTVAQAPTAPVATPAPAAGAPATTGDGEELSDADIRQLRNVAKKLWAEGRP